MGAVHKNIIIFAAIVKLIILFFIVIVGQLPNHEADAFNPPCENCTTIVDCTLRHALDGFRKWDAVYFHFIAIHGYLYENTLAFFPLLPIVLRLLSSLTLVMFNPPWSFFTHTILSGVCLSFICNVMCALQIYRLSKLTLISDSVSIVAALLFVINPASIFFASLYSESLYCLLFVTALIYVQQGSYIRASIFLFLTVCCRSNGLVNVGFACFPHFINLSNIVISVWTTLKSNHFKNPPYLKVVIAALYRFTAIALIITYVCLPYVVYQCYAGYLFCSTSPKPSYLLFMTPEASNEELEAYAHSLDARTPHSTHTSTLPDWCAGVPWSSYSRLQKTFWNVGPLNYYQWKQMPNFLLALPVIMLVCKTAQLFEQTAPWTLVSFGVIAEHRRQQLILPHVYHVIFLLAYGVIIVHIQVLTRMLFSSCPVIYWYCAAILLGEESDVFGKPSGRKLKGSAKTSSSVKPRQLGSMFRLVNPLTYASWSIQRLLLYYFYGYTVVGCLMHSNFLPWT